MSSETEILKAMLSEKQREVDEMTKLFSEFKIESAELEDVLEKQSELYQQELDQEREKSRLMELSAAQQIASLKLQQIKEIKTRDEQIASLTANLEMYKEICEKLTGSAPESKKEGEAAAKLEFTKENFELLSQQIDIKNETIQSLATEIEQNRLTLKSQQELFKKLTDDVSQFSATSNKRLNDLENIKENEINTLKEQLRQKSQQLEQQGQSEEQDILSLKELLLKQTDRLKSISKDFQEFKQHSENLLENEKLQRDLRIQELEKKSAEEN